MEGEREGGREGERRRGSGRERDFIVYPHLLLPVSQRDVLQKQGRRFDESS